MKTLDYAVFSNPILGNFGSTFLVLGEKIMHLGSDGSVGSRIAVLKFRVKSKVVFVNHAPRLTSSDHLIVMFKLIH